MVPFFIYIPYIYKNYILMLASEIIYNVKNLVAGGIQSDDIDLSLKQMMFVVDYYRARLFKQDQDKGRFNTELYLQNLGKVELINADKNECCGITSCVLRTKFKIPRPLETFQKINITFVGLLDGKSFQRYTINSIQWKHANKFTSKEPGWYWQNGYIYIVNPPTEMLTWVNIQGIFERPIDAIKFRTCDCTMNEENCFETLDFEYPFPQHYVDTLVKLIMGSEYKILLTLPPDTANNAESQISGARDTTLPTK